MTMEIKSTAHYIDIRGLGTGMNIQGAGAFRTNCKILLFMILLTQNYTD